MRSFMKKIMAMIFAMGLLFSEICSHDVFARAENESSLACSERELASQDEEDECDYIVEDENEGSDYDEDKDEGDYIAIDEDDDDEEEMDNDDNMVDSIDNMIIATFNITRKWSENYNVDVTIENISGEAIDDWELEFRFKDEIENIWNATVTSHNGDVYTVRSADWNQDIPDNERVSFGMTVKYTGEIEFPENIFLTRECIKVEGDYDVQYRENSRRNNYVNGQIIITNNTGHRIEDWKLDLSGNLEIENIWNAKVVSKWEDISRIDNADYNQNSETGQSVEFGFIAKVNGKDVDIDFLLSEMTETEIEYEDIEEPEYENEGYYDDSDEEELEITLEDYLKISWPEGYVPRFDDFETDELYEEYLEYIGASKGETAK